MPDGAQVLERFSATTQVVIRACVATDLAELEWHGCFTPHRGIIADAFARQQRGEVLMLVAEAARFPVGQIWIDFIKAGAGAAALWAFRVIRCMQGMGIGDRLLAAAERSARARGCCRAEVGCERSNERARRFYERRGYVRVRERVEHYSYVTPEGLAVSAASDMWILQKLVLPGASASHEPPGGTRP